MQVAHGVVDQFRSPGIDDRFDAVVAELGMAGRAVILKDAFAGFDARRSIEVFWFYARCAAAEIKIEPAAMSNKAVALKLWHVADQDSWCQQIIFDPVRLARTFADKLAGGRGQRTG